MEKNLKLIDCIISSEITRTNNEWMHTIVDILHDFYDDAKDVTNGRNIYMIDDECDFKRLIDMYGVCDAVRLANRSNFGYVIAGEDVMFDKVVIITEENFWELFETMSTIIGDRIITIYKKYHYSLAHIQTIYPEIDVRKFILSNENFIVRIETKGVNNHSIEHMEFNTRCEAEGWIITEMAKYMCQCNDSTTTIKRDEDIFVFEDIEGFRKITFTFVDSCED